jgi:hypothetical protein
MLRGTIGNTGGVQMNQSSGRKQGIYYYFFTGTPFITSKGDQSAAFAVSLQWL